MKLEVGMYVRTKDGKIGKIMGYYAFDKNKIAIWTKTTEKGIEITPVIDKDTIVKASYNIIDLIEKNDYINGSRVNEIVDGKPIHEDYNDPFYSFGWENDDIKTVITHEQIEQISYKI